MMLTNKEILEIGNACDEIYADFQESCGDAQDAADKTFVHSVRQIIAANNAKVLADLKPDTPFYDDGMKIYVWSYSAAQVSAQIQRNAELEAINVRYKKAYIALCEPPSIAQSIRNAAINWPQYLGDVECGILGAFCEWSEWEGAMFYEEQNEQIKGRTFMLFVAEALE